MSIEHTENQKNELHAGVYSEIETITPELARHYLDANMRNRAVSKDAVARYVGDMDNGSWQISGDSIKFDTDGRLIDGQHRLLAIIQHGYPVSMFVTRGLNPKASIVLDTGKVRSAGDSLAILGVAKLEDSKTIASAVKIIIRHDDRLHWGGWLRWRRSIYNFSHYRIYRSS